MSSPRRRSGIKPPGVPVKARSTLHLATESEANFNHDDEILALPDGHRRSVKLGLSGPTLRLAKDADEAIMGTDDDR